MTMRQRPVSGVLALVGFAIACFGALPGTAEPRCTCRYAGQSYALGSCTCIDRPGAAPQFACCGMVLNNTSWKFSGEGCPVAMSEPADTAQSRPLSGADLDVAARIALARE